jgi:GNAT superfamily N-acetyltransferase
MTRDVGVGLRPAGSIVPLEPRHAAACEAIGRALPAWFGIEDGLRELRRAAERGPGVAALDGAGRLVGFLTVTRHFPESWDVSWMAVHPDHHRRGIGRRLVEALVEEARANGVRLIQVKTLADRHPSPEYALTRRFYSSLGFHRLEVFPDLWDAANPCLVLVRPL